MPATRRAALFPVLAAIALGVAAAPPAALSQSAPASPAASPAATGTVLVTGASRGIGFEFVRQYVEAGWTVIATARKPQESSDLVELASRNPKVRLEQLDVVDAASVAALKERLAGVPIDVLINNAGDTDQFRGQSFGKLAHDRFGYLMELNAHGPMRVTEALVGNVEAGRQKKILAVSSLAGSFGANGGGMPGGYWYKASKAALNVMMLSLAQDLKPRGILVACLSPGQVDTQGYAKRGITMPGMVDIKLSVGGMRKVVDGLTAAQSGTFIRYNGEVQPW
ncbi:MAG: SDR family oxidoreductase [Steroidobacteraceae bacterium]|jgi:NAD(P)-dependent dehydrogenase (short-subunit alcohol dehydrogenase family)|nr:SDR family oxidoreductase [Steroidobacteraceae bacterium]